MLKLFVNTHSFGDIYEFHKTGCDPDTVIGRKDALIPALFVHYKQ